MEKFRDLEYRRPDFALSKKRLEACTKKVRKASSYEEYREAYLELEEIIKEVYTQSSIAYIRNTIDTTDKFYEEENAAISKGSARIALSEQKAVKALCSSPYRKQFDEEFGPILMTNLETQIRLVNLLVLPDMVKEDKLGRTYSKDVAACKTEFRGEECNFYGLLKHMESTDRQERKEAFLAWADLYESVSGKLDDTYDKLVKLRVRKAKKLGFSSYIDYIYPARGRLDYTAEDAARFRDQVRDVIVPFCSELYAGQAERLGVEKLHWYDEGLVFPEGNAVPVGDKDELVEKALRMYTELSPETEEFFTFMCDHDLFDLETRPG